MWIARLEQEQENLCAALVWLIEREEAEMALQLCRALWWFWHIRGYWSQGRRWLEAALRLPDAGERTVVRAKALFSAGDLAFSFLYTGALVSCINISRTRSTLGKA